MEMNKPTVIYLNADIWYKQFRKAVISGDCQEGNVINDIFRRFILKFDGNYTKIVSKGNLFYRARPLGEDDICNHKQLGINVDINDRFKGCDYYNSIEPPNGIAKASRCNKENISVLYLADDEYTACCEVKPDLGQLISVAKFMNKQELKMIDLYSGGNRLDSQFWGDVEKNNISIDSVISYIKREFRAAVSNEKDYSVTQYFSEMIKENGYDGIVFKSSLTGHCNYVLFKGAERNGFEMLDSKIVRLYTPKYCFIDFNEDQVMPITETYADPNKLIISDNKDKTKRQLNNFNRM